MSWQAYADNMMGQKLKKVAIIGNQNNDVWTAGGGMAISQAEAKDIVEGFKTENKPKIQAGGVKLDGEKFLYLQSDETQIQAKKGKGGLTIAKAGTCTIVGEYDDQLNPGQARNIVEKMRDYLATNGF